MPSTEWRICTAHRFLTALELDPGSNRLETLMGHGSLWPTTRELVDSWELWGGQLGARGEALELGWGLPRARMGHL